MRFLNPYGRAVKPTLGRLDLSGNEADEAPVIGQPLSLKSEQNGVLNLDAKDLFFFYATGVTPAMTEKMIGKGSQHAGAFVDAKGEPLTHRATPQAIRAPPPPKGAGWSE